MTNPLTPRDYIAIQIYCANKIIVDINGADYRPTVDDAYYQADLFLKEREKQHE